MIYWFIGQPGCGKTTLAKMFAEWTRNFTNKSVLHLDGDDLRHIFGGNYKQEHFTKEYRDNNTLKLQNFVEYVDKQGVSVVVSTVNPTRLVRESFKTRYPRVMEIYVINSGDHVRKDFNVNGFEEPIAKFIKIDTKDLTPDQSFYILKEQIIKNYPYE